MMRRLVLVRHAKAVDPDFDADDHARALTERGRRDARAIAELLAGRGLVPSRALVSDAVRTSQTWTEMSAWFPEADVVTTPRLYHAELSTFVDVLEAAPDAAETLFVVGHNPGLEDLVRYLTQQLVAISTAMAVVIEPPTDGSWADGVRRRDWRVGHVARPVP